MKAKEKKAMLEDNLNILKKKEGLSNKEIVTLSQLS
jgi:hypothetical protein